MGEERSMFVLMTDCAGFVNLCVCVEDHRTRLQLWDDP